MALVKYGGGIIQMSGSIAGNTYARNRYGNYVRARTKPVNPNTELQQVIRNAMAAMTTRWSQILSAVQRAAWSLYGANVSMKNRLGEAVFLTGFNHYLRSNIIRVQSGISVVDDGPVIFELPAKDPTFEITATDGAQTIDIIFDDTLDWATETDAWFVTYQGTPQNSQRNFFAGPWRLMDNLAGADGGAPSSPDTQAVIFPIAEGQKQWVYARILRKDGRVSSPFRGDVAVSA